VALFMVACSALGAVSTTSSLVARVMADLVIVALLTGYLASPQLLARARRSAAERTSGAMS
jgi:hypothetical protein